LLDNALTSRNNFVNSQTVVTGFGHTEERGLHDRQITEPSEHLKQTFVFIEEHQL